MTTVTSVIMFFVSGFDSYSVTLAGQIVTGFMILMLYSTLQ